MTLAGRCRPKPAWGLASLIVSRPVRFEHYRYVGDKRSLVVYDLDLYASDPDVAAAVDELMESEQFVAFAPQLLSEARNRGYRPHRSILVAEADDE